MKMPEDREVLAGEHQFQVPQRTDSSVNAVNANAQFGTWSFRMVTMVSEVAAAITGTT